MPVSEETIAGDPLRTLSKLSWSRHSPLQRLPEGAGPARFEGSGTGGAFEPVAGQQLGQPAQIGDRPVVPRQVPDPHFSWGRGVGTRGSQPTAIRTECRLGDSAAVNE